MIPKGSKHDPVMAHKLNRLYTYAFNHIDSVLIISELQPIQKWYFAKYGFNMVKALNWDLKDMNVFLDPVNAIYFDHVETIFGIALLPDGLELWNYQNWVNMVESFHI